LGQCWPSTGIDFIGSGSGLCDLRCFTYIRHVPMIIIVASASTQSPDDAKAANNTHSSTFCARG
jgi:hypothetical protein